MTPLREKMINDMTLRGMAVHTQECYLRAVQGLTAYYHRSPELISDEEIQKYFLHLIKERGFAWSSCNVARNGLKFFYKVTMGKKDADFCLPRAREPQKLPEILSKQEVERLFKVTPNLKHRVILMTTYGAGLRVSEVVKLKVTDIDRERMFIRVNEGKGGKDRLTLLSKRLYLELRRYWDAFRPAIPWFFPKRNGQEPTDTGTVQKIFYLAKKKAGISKVCGIHGLRHAFATHLLESGVSVPVIQRLLGHKQVSTTMRYLHVTQQHLEKITSPLDMTGNFQQVRA